MRRRAKTICAAPQCPRFATEPDGRCFTHTRKGGRRWRRLRDVVIARANGHCEGCGLPTLLFNVHHLDDVGFGNVELADPERLLALCSDCHRAAHRGTSGSGSELPD